MIAKIKQWLQIMNAQRPALGLVMTPSWLSGLVAVVVGLGVVVGVVGMNYYNGSSLQLLHTTASSPQAINDNFEEIDTNFSASQLLSDIPLFILWGGVGFIAYFFTINIFDSFRRAVDFEHELDYVHVNRQQLIREATTRLIFRLLMLLIWVLYIEFTLHALLPYVVALAAAGTTGLNWWQALYYEAGAAAILTIGVQLHAIMLRLVLLKPRVFGNL